MTNMKLFELIDKYGDVVNSRLAWDVPTGWATPKMKTWGYTVTERDVSEPRLVRGSLTFDLTPLHGPSCGRAVCTECSVSCHCTTRIIKAPYTFSQTCVAGNRNSNKLLYICKQRTVPSMQLSDINIVLRVAHRDNETFQIGDYVILPRGRNKTTRYRIIKFYGHSSNGAAYVATFSPR